MTRTRTLSFVSHFAWLALTGLKLAAQTVPATINYQGRLTDNGSTPAPITATVNMTFEIWDVQSGGTTAPDRLWIEPASGSVPVQVTNGIFSVLLGGNGVPVPASIFSGGTTRYLQIIANGETLAPRQTIAAAAYANQAQNSSTAATAANAANAVNSGQLGGVAASGYQLATVQNCGANFVSAIGNGYVTCTPVPANNLTPPVTLSGSISSPILSATNSGSGTAGSFVNNGSGGDALNASAGGAFGNAITASNTGGGSAGNFSINNASNTSQALTVSTNGTGAALYAYTTGGGTSRAAYFSAGGTAFETLYSESSGGVRAGRFNVVGAASGGTALYASNGGIGRAGEFSISGASNASAALSASTAGTGFAVFGSSAGGTAGWFSSGGGGSSYGVIGLNTGTGAAGEFDINNAASGANALAASTNGTGRVAYFTQSNAANGSNAVEISNTGSGTSFSSGNNGTGAAGFFQQSNGGASAAAVSASNSGSGPVYMANANGSGRAGLFRVNGASNASDALLALTNGTGVAVRAQSGTASAKPLVAQGAFGQTSNLQEWQDNTAFAMSWVDNLGGFHGNGAGLTGVTASGLALPYSGTDATAAASAFAVVKSGTSGEAADFSVTDTLTTSDALHVTHAGRGNVIYANKTNNSGTGAGVRVIASGQNAIYATSASATGVYGESTSATGVWGNSGTGRGVNGGSSTNFGVIGTSAVGGPFSLGNNAVGVAGINANSGDYGFLGAASAGVFGSSNGGGHYSVQGSANGGATGVNGVVLAGNTGTAGSFQNNNASNALPALTVTTSAATAALSVSGASTTAPALAIAQGALQVTGAGDNTTTAAFIHRATAPSGNYSCINNPMTNGNPNLLLFVTQNWSPPTNPGIYNPHPVGIFYNSGPSQWCIFNEDNAAMPVNAAFNVMVIKP